MGAALKINGVQKNFGTKRVLQDVSFEVGAGEVVGLVGNNGCGKTTLIKCCMGLLDYQGKIEILGADGGLIDARKNPKHTFLQMHWLTQPTGWYDAMSGYDNLSLYSKLYDKKLTKRDVLGVMEKCGLQEDVATLVGSYSLGMTQRLAIAKCMLYKPKIILMDEPLNGLDVNAVDLFVDWCKELREQGAAVLISCHDTNAVQRLCTRVVVVSKGKIVGQITEMDDTLKERCVQLTGK
ncbi:MAG: ABC transporter ATP-binding protein [Firmicutes bacterium]|nr:ABC transporter ATP-binding protein [Bacillota bacterium]